MTDGLNKDGNYLVQVRAQVMTRDDSTGGWVPMGGGGLSCVSILKLVLPTAESEEPKHEYIVYGKRLSDQSVSVSFRMASLPSRDMVVLRCTIKKDFQYNRVMPTFHHWKTGDKKFGLTFATASDARAFDKGVRIAMEDLDGPGLLQFHEAELGDDDVFMTLDLPAVESTSPLSHKPILPRNGSGIADVPQKVCPEEVWRVQEEAAGEAYVQFDKGTRTEHHDYTYVEQASVKPPAVTKKPTPPKLPVKKEKQRRRGWGRQEQLPVRQGRAQCSHCLESFNMEANPRGGCEFAPDPVLACIDRVSCLHCAQAVLYHCATDPEADLHPCSTENRSCLRWAGLGLLSLLLPCLWCYPPLRACHRCGVACGICGARHHPGNT